MTVDTAERRLIVLWALLIAMTFASWESGASLLDHRVQTSIILGLAFVKVGLIGSEFMEVRHAPNWLRLAFAGWMFVVCGAVLVMLWFPTLI